MQATTTTVAASKTVPDRPPPPYQAVPTPGAPSQTCPTQMCDGTGFWNRTSILKITQIGFSALTFICTMVDYWYRAARFISFVGFSSMLVAIVYLAIHSIQRLHNSFGECTYLFELIQYCVWSVFFLIAAIVAMVNAFDALIATAIFATGGTIAFSIDTFFQLRDWQYRRTRNSQQNQQAQQLGTLAMSQPPPVTIHQPYPQPVTMIQPQPVAIYQPQHQVVNLGMHAPRPRYNLILF